MARRVRCSAGNDDRLPRAIRDRGGHRGRPRRGHRRRDRDQGPRPLLGIRFRAARERFIIGTLVSMIWASLCAALIVAG